MFKWLFGTVKPKPELPKVGSLWGLANRNGDPFPSKKYPPSVILDVKDGWVRYRIGSVFNDERMELSSFLYVYRKV
jgi:hypothetical protein